ncbi:MAG TPA: DUF1015 domain-containing protein [Chloroflexota bacterium]|jgi:uncharacterized protein (DUF1015 family)|nr:DUF1015 domain-containing protein [Chloroflexota bacterium]
MLQLRPFAALRYAAVDSLGAVIAPPYDVISPAQQDELYARDPHNVIRLELSRGGTDEPLAGRYAHAAEALRTWRRRNVLGRDPFPVYYPYEERFPTPRGDRIRRGVFATVRLHPWSDGVIRPHERTRPKPKADRRELLHTCRTQFSPVFSLFEDARGAVRELLEESMRGVPVACAQVRPGAAGEIATSHQLWQMTGSPAERLTELFRDKQLYIADGHHRYETALDYRDERRHALNRVDPDAPYEFVMMLLVAADDPGLVVLPTHRMVALPLPLDPPAARSAWARYFEVESAPLPNGRRPGEAVYAELQRRGRDLPVFAALGVQPGRVDWLTLRHPPARWDAPATWRELDVGLLQRLVVEPLEHGQPGTSVEFTRDPDEALAHAEADERNAAFLLNATGVDQILAVARAGDRMPEKSTYFAPKVATGLVMYPLE